MAVLVASLITSPVQDPAKINASSRWRGSSPGLAVVVEDAANVRMLGEASAAAASRSTC